MATSCSTFLTSAGNLAQVSALTVSTLVLTAPMSALSMLGATSAILKVAAASGHSMAPSVTPVWTWL